MNKLTKNEKGFSVVEISLSLLVILLVVMVGFLIYKNNQKTKAKPIGSIQRTIPQTRQSTLVNPYSGWLTCDTHNVGGNITFKYPPDWTQSGRYSGCGAINGPDAAQPFMLTSATYGESSRYMEFYFYGCPQANTSDPYTTTNVLSVTPLKMTMQGMPAMYADLFEYYSLDPSTTSTSPTVRSLELVLTSHSYSLGQQSASYDDDSCFQTGDPNVYGYQSMSADLMEKDADYKKTSQPYTASDYTNSPYYQDILKIFESVSY